MKKADMINTLLSEMTFYANGINFARWTGRNENESRTAYVALKTLANSFGYATNEFFYVDHRRSEVYFCGLSMTIGKTTIYISCLDYDCSHDPLLFRDEIDKQVLLNYPDAKFILDWEG